MDKIFIDNLNIEAIIGTLPRERTQKQPLIINLEIATDIRKAAASENLADTIDYIAIANHVTDLVSNSSYLLLETLAEKIAGTLLAQFKIASLRLQITKPNAIANAQGARILIERHA